MTCSSLAGKEHRLTVNHHLESCVPEPEERVLEGLTLEDLAWMFPSQLTHTHTHTYTARHNFRGPDACKVKNWNVFQQYSGTLCIFTSDELYAKEFMFSNYGAGEDS